MIRRPASLIGTGEAGFVLNWFIQDDTTVDAKSVMTFEMKPADSSGNPGVVSIQPADNIRFDDGSPDTIPEIE